MLRTMFVLSATLAGILSPASPSYAVTDRTMEFDVYLDDRLIGSHRFDIQQSDDNVLQVESVASFDVKFLFFTAYRYRHESNERWQSGCLREIDADTDANGKKTAVAGTAEDGALTLSANARAEILDGCVMTFAYWNPEFLDQDQLLNPQTGEYLDVEISDLGETDLQLENGVVRAREYRIVAKDVEVNVWYQEDGRWVALESPAKGGRILRYERV